MWPPGYFGAPNVVPDHVNLENGGTTMRDAIQAAQNVNYQATTSMDFYPAHGACDDWMYDAIVTSPNPNAAVNKGLVYTIELTPDDSSDVCAFGPRLRGFSGCLHHA